MASLLLALTLLAGPGVTAPVANAPAPNGPMSLVGVAPALTATALRDELRARSQQRQQELAALARERAELEKAAADVAAARAALEANRRAQPEPKPATSKDKEKDGRSDPAGRPEGRSAAVASTPSSPEALAKTVKGMKADQAAALVQRLDRGLAVDVLRRMRPADAGAILEKMKGETAAEFFSAMAAGRPASAQGQR